MFEPNESTDKYLYHYTKEKTFLEYIWPNRTLKLSAFSQTNDPRESHMWYYIFSSRYPFNKNQDDIGINKLKKREKLNNEIDSVVRNCNILCLSMDYKDKPQTINYGRGFQHPRMWAQYADNHRGVCLVLNKQRFIATAEAELSAKGQLWMEPVNYMDMDDFADNAMKIDINECTKLGVDVYMKDHIVKYYQDFYFRKHVDWKDEQEYRIVLRDGNEDSVYLSFEDSLEMVITGVDFPKELTASITEQCLQLKKKIGQLQWWNGLPSLGICG